MPRMVLEATFCARAGNELTITNTTATAQRILSSTSTPLIQGDYVYSDRWGGNLVCMEARTGKLGRITASFGVAIYRKGEGPSSFIERADRCLYAAKHAGRNRVFSETELTDDGIAAA